MRRIIVEKESSPRQARRCQLNQNLLAQMLPSIRPGTNLGPNIRWMVRKKRELTVTETRLTSTTFVRHKHFGRSRIVVDKGSWMRQSPTHEKSHTTFLASWHFTRPPSIDHGIHTKMSCFEHVFGITPFPLLWLHFAPHLSFSIINGSPG